MTTFPYDPDGYGLEAPPDIPDEAVYAAVRALPSDPDYINVESVRSALAAALPHLWPHDYEALDDNAKALVRMKEHRIAVLEGERNRFGRIEAEAMIARACIANLEDGIRELEQENRDLHARLHACPRCLPADDDRHPADPEHRTT